jgi:integrase/recombinase XerD
MRRANEEFLRDQQEIINNPAATLRVDFYSIVEGKTPEITPDQVAKPLASIDSSIKVGLRERAVLAVLIYTAAPAGAVARLTLKNGKHDASHYTLRLSENCG